MEKGQKVEKFRVVATVCGSDVKDPHYVSFKHAVVYELGQQGFRKFVHKDALEFRCRVLTEGVDRYEPKIVTVSHSHLDTDEQKRFIEAMRGVVNGLGRIYLPHLRDPNRKR